MSPGPIPLTAFTAGLGDPVPQGSLVDATSIFATVGQKRGWCDVIVDEWWAGRTLVNGVFRGGARRVWQDAGAIAELEELDDSGWGGGFGAVAGASAGALT